MAKGWRIAGGVLTILGGLGTFWLNLPLILSIWLTYGATFIAVLMLISIAFMIIGGIYLCKDTAAGGIIALFGAFSFPPVFSIYFGFNLNPFFLIFQILNRR